MTRAPFISIITATRDAAAHLPKLVASLRAQSFRDFEWIVIDGGSTDGTLDLIKQNADLIHAWVSELDTGMYEAWNKGLRRMRGTWICFLGADDWLWSADALQKMVTVLERAYPPIRVVYGQIALVNRVGETLYFAGDEWSRVRRRFRSAMNLPHPGLMHHRSLFDQYGGFDTSYKIAGDYEFLLRELKLHDALFARDLIIAGMLCYGLSSIPRAIGLSLIEVRRATRKHGRIFPGISWVLAIGRHGVRRLLWLSLGEHQARKILDCGRCLLGKPRYWTKV